MKFIADSMLGRLARWLRIIGCDVEYCANITDEELIRRAREDERTILTRDTLLARRKAAQPCLLIRSEDHPMQLREVVDRFSLDPYSEALTRCVKCNHKLKALPKGSAQGKVPPYVYATQEKFSICPRCGKIFWNATHIDKIMKKLGRIFPETDRRPIEIRLK
ncbi:MAG: Mut7-C RNAse domain-containing protein [bacterium]